MKKIDHSTNHDKSSQSHHNHTSHVHATNKENTIMSTPSDRHASITHTTTHTTESNHSHHAAHAAKKGTIMKTESDNTTATATTSEPSPATASNGGSLIFMKAPPADAKVPVPPEDFVAPPATDFRGVPPKSGQLAAMPDAVAELGNFPDYATTFGKTAPPLTYVLSVLQAASGWTSQRKATKAWGTFCATQEGQSWREARNVIERMSPAYDLAVQTDPTLAQRFPGMKALFGAGKVTASKALSTRKANAKLKAEGKLENKGNVGKKRQRAAEKAAMAQQQQQASVPQAGAPQAGAPQVGAPQQAGVVVAPAGSGNGNAGGNGGTNGVNGAAHS